MFGGSHRGGACGYGQQGTAMPGLAESLCGSRAGGQCGTTLQGQPQRAPIEAAQRPGALQGRQNTGGDAAADELIGQRALNRLPGGGCPGATERRRPVDRALLQKMASFHAFVEGMGSGKHGFRRLPCAYGCAWPALWQGPWWRGGHAVYGPTPASWLGPRRVHAPGPPWRPGAMGHNLPVCGPYV